MRPPLPSHCPNCDSALTGRYCASCGQDCGNLRFDTWFMLAEGTRQLAGWDGSLTRTLKGLWTDPGGLSRDYVQGRRRSHLNPARFCLVSLGLWLIALRVLGFDVLDSAGIQFSLGDAESGAQTEKVRAFVIRHFDWLLFITFPVRAWVMKLSFRRSGAGVAECLVQVLYVAGFGFLLGSLLAVMDAAGLHGAYMARPFIGLIWAVRAAHGYFHTSWLEAAIKMLLVSFAHVVAAVLIVALIAIPWIL